MNFALPLIFPEIMLPPAVPPFITGTGGEVRIFNASRVAVTLDLFGAFARIGRHGNIGIGDRDRASG